MRYTRGLSWLKFIQITHFLNPLRHGALTAESMISCGAQATQASQISDKHRRIRAQTHLRGRGWRHDAKDQSRAHEPPCHRHARMLEQPHVILRSNHLIIPLVHQTWSVQSSAVLILATFQNVNLRYINRIRNISNTSLIRTWWSSRP